MTLQVYGAITYAPGLIGDGATAQISFDVRQQILNMVGELNTMDLVPTGVVSVTGASAAQLSGTTMTLTFSPTPAFGARFPSATITLAFNFA